MKRAIKKVKNDNESEKKNDSKSEQSSKKRRKHIQCHYVGCKKKFYGHPATKYCRFHRKIKNRVIIKKEVVSEEDCNKIFEHDYLEPVITEFKCELKGCEQVYKVLLLPKLNIYPKYCQEHRNEHRRKIFLNEPIQPKVIVIKKTDIETIAEFLSNNGIVPNETLLKHFLKISKLCFRSLVLAINNSR